MGLMKTWKIDETWWDMDKNPSKMLIRIDHSKGVCKDDKQNPETLVYTICRDLDPILEVFYW